MGEQDGGNEYAALFVSMTGREVLTEHQHREAADRDPVGREHRAVSAAVTAATRADGLEDAIETPEDV